MDKRASRMFSRQALLVLAGLAVLLILSGLIGVSTYQSHVASVSATATSFRATISAREAQATATTVEKNVEVTATANAQATATEQVLDPYGGTLTASDPMSKPETAFAWDNGSNNAGENCSFQNNAYHVVGVCISRGSLSHGSLVGTLNGKFAFEVHLTAGSNCGTIFVGDGDATVCQSGNYSLLGGQSFHLGETTAMHTGSDQSNVIAVVVDGTSLKLYVNATAVDSIPGNYTNASGLSLGGYAREGLGAGIHFAEVIYGNARLWSLP